jgi:uncharacterized ion transporter superfamily protein YfcC
MEAQLAEETHEFDAISALALNLVIIGCLLLTYAVKKFRIYSLPESAGALLMGMVIGGIVRLTTDDMTLFVFVSCSRRQFCVKFPGSRSRALIMFPGPPTVPRSFLFLFVTTHNF